MSTNLNPKRLLFDSVFYTYSLALIGYTLFELAGALGLHDIVWDKESAVRQMPTLVWTTFAMLIGFAIVSHLFDRLRLSTLGDVLFAGPARKAELAEIPFFSSFWGLHLSITFVLTLIVSAQVTDLSFAELVDDQGLAGAGRLLTALANANLALLPTAIVEVVETIFIAFLGTVVAIPIAFLLAFVCAKNLMKHPAAFAVYVTLRTLLNIMRSVEPLIWAIIFTVWVGVGPFAGMLALMIHSIASLTKQYSEIVEGVSEGPIEGIRSTGASTLQVIWYAIVPQVVLPYIAFTIYRWDINVRMATVIGLVGGGGIGTLLIKYSGQAMWSEVGCIIIVIASVVWLMDTASAYIREALK